MPDLHEQVEKAEQDTTILQRRNLRMPDMGRNIVTVGQIFGLIRAGFNTRRILKADPQINPETILLARACLAARYPDAYNRFCTGNTHQTQDYRILLDENMPRDLIPQIMSGYGYMTHNHLSGLRGKNDRDVWQWAVNNNVDAIFTMDRRNKSKKDLTRIAQDDSVHIASLGTGRKQQANINELPLIVHAENKKNPKPYLRRIFTQHAGLIHCYLEKRITPFILVRENGVALGPTYAELLKPQRQEDKTRQEQWEQKWLARIFNNADLSGHTPEQVAQIEQQVRTCAALCAAMPAVH